MVKPKKPLSFQSPKGMHDILPQEYPWWDKIRKEAREVVSFYNFSRIETPIVEDASLLERSVGEASEIVEKQMFVFKTRGGDRMVLRPESTAAVARAYIQHGLSHLSQPLKVFYDGPMFRYEQPQAGRYRQFHQLGFEIIGGDDDPIYEAQVIVPVFRILEGLKFKKLTLHVNTIGCKTCRPVYVKKLQDYFKAHQKDLCKDCLRRLQTNPLRILDCKNPDCQKTKQGAPSILDSICSFCNKHFKAFLEYLEELNLPYQLNTHLVRGLDYYNRSVFEIYAEGFDFALAGGGRYDYLIEMLGGRATPAVGISIGMERVVEVMKTLNLNPTSRSRSKVFLVFIGTLAKKKSLTIIEEFRKAHIDIAESLGKESLNTQLRNANKEGSELALILGQKEVFEESIIIRDLKTGVQEIVPLKKIVAEIKKRV